MPSLNNTPNARPIITVSQLNRMSNAVLNQHFLSVWVEGEISNLSMPNSGHWYFSLKDANAQVRCAMFKNQQRRQGVKPENGNQVLVKAQVSLYEPRGDYQLIVEAIEAAGEGALRRAFEILKQKLSAEGLFDARHKQALPLLPQSIGIITSPTGAALRDVLSVLKRRFAGISVIIYPVAVQGENAKYEIAQALAKANANPLCDVLILGRGGGSLEDLWAFNEELVARAIYTSQIPVICAVGHETDFTIADFVADLRAPTPSVAAEHASPDAQDWLARFCYLEKKLQQLMQQKLNQQQQALDWLGKRLQQQHPGAKLSRNIERVNGLSLRLHQAMLQRLQLKHSRLAMQTARLNQHNPAEQIISFQKHTQYLQQRLMRAMTHKLEKLNQQMGASGQTLQAVSPLATLQRGYAIVSKPVTGQIIRNIQELTVGERIEILFGEGRCFGEISSIIAD
ncbi:MAG: exodeoxyribonuclease VII large subunit [Methylovulum sp.]|nr:exodeoxyribonuclease VII large subunit [Methylovulum sp.]MCF7998630.1 exodeoxyribonuclease VII large subunit [Methylovulum sp.]MCF8006342.1 exodeoxyribonuclease VII large subunit [Methylovulum sp.]